MDVQETRAPACSTERTLDRQRAGTPRLCHGVPARLVVAVWKSASAGDGDAEDVAELADEVVAAKVLGLVLPRFGCAGHEIGAVIDVW